LTPTAARFFPTREVEIGGSRRATRPRATSICDRARDVARAHRDRVDRVYAAAAASAPSPRKREISPPANE